VRQFPAIVEVILEQALPTTISEAPRTIPLLFTRIELNFFLLKIVLNLAKKYKKLFSYRVCHVLSYTLRINWLLKEFEGEHG
jgi:hypothetical protein